MLAPCFSKSDEYSEAGRILTEGIEYAQQEGLLGHDTSFSAGGEIYALRLTRRGEAFIRSSGHGSLRQDTGIREILHPAILGDAFLELERGAKHYPDAIYKAFRAVEIAVRDAGALSEGDIGMKLMHKAFDPGGPLANSAQEPGEQAALAQLFAGAIGTYKNPTSHREAPSAAKTALRALTLASELLFIVDDAKYRVDERAAIQQFGP